MNRPTLFAKMRAKRGLLQDCRAREDQRQAACTVPRDQLRELIAAIESEFTHEWQRTMPPAPVRIAPAPRPYQDPPRRRWFSFGTVR